MGAFSAQYATNPSLKGNELLPEKLRLLGMRSALSGLLFEKNLFNAT
jgi:hypothetical protein